MSAPLVSVVIAAFNAARFLPGAVRSALGQTLADLEVVVVDDGSTDRTADSITPFLGLDARLSLFRQPNRGQACAKNEGIRRSKGQYVAFLDADDQWEQRKLEAQVPRFDDPRVGVVYTDAAYIDENGVLFSRPRSRYYSGDVTRELFVDNFVNFPSAVVRRSCLEAVGAFDETLPMGIDWDLWLRLSVDWRFDFVDEPLLFYRSWAGQMSKNIDGRFECAVRIMRQFAAAHPDRLDRRTLREGWVTTYLNHAVRLAHAGRRREGVRALCTALSLAPLRRRTWVEVARYGWQ